MQRTRLLTTATFLFLNCIFCSMSYSQAVEPHYDTIYSGPPGSEFVALAVSNFGEIGQAGAGGVNMDFTACGLECGTRHADSVYLYSASPFLLEADGTHTNISLTCSYGQTAPTKAYSWIPVEFDWEQVQKVYRCQMFGLEPVGKVVTPDGHFAAEVCRVTTDYSPALAIKILTFLTRVYAIDGESHPNVTVGWVENWNVPSDVIDSNLSKTDEYGLIYYLEGTDTVSSQGCISSIQRLASSGVSGVFKGGLNQWNICVGNLSQERTIVGPANLLQDIEYPQGSGIFRPDAAAWWNLIESGGRITVADSAGDVAVWNTAVRDFEIGTEPLYFWTRIVTAYKGNPDWMYQTSGSFGPIAGDCFLDCSYGQVGDVNGSGQEIPTIGDVSALIDAKFVSGQCISSGPGTNVRCFAEADINKSGGDLPSCDDITIGDIAMLIDYLFITGPSMELPCCSDIP